MKSLSTSSFEATKMLVHGKKRLMRHGVSGEGAVVRNVGVRCISIFAGPVVLASLSSWKQNGSYTKAPKRALLRKSHQFANICFVRVEMRRHLQHKDAQRLNT